MIKNILLIMTAILFLSCSNVKEEAEPEPIQEPEPPAVVEKNRLCAIRDEREADFTFDLENPNISIDGIILLLDNHEKVIQAVKDQKASAYVMIDCTDPNNPIIASYSLDPSRSQTIARTPNNFQLAIDAKKEVFPSFTDPQLIANYFPLVDDFTIDKFFPYDKTGGAYSFEADFEGDDTDLETYIAIWGGGGEDNAFSDGLKRELSGIAENDYDSTSPVKQEDIILLVVEGYEEILNEPDKILGDIIYWGSLDNSIFNFPEFIF